VVPAVEMMHAARFSRAVESGPTVGEPASQYGWILSNTTTLGGASMPKFVPELQAEHLEIEQSGTGAGLTNDDLHFPRDEDRGRVQLSVARDSAKGSTQHSGGKSLTCDHAGCSYVGTFRRQWELQRHIAAKHTTEKPFWCPVIGCIKGKGAPAFARPDKLTTHMRTVHRDKDAQAICPAATCPDTALGLDVLGVHIKLQHLGSKPGGVVGGLFRAITNATSTDHRHCPLWFCKARVHLEDFPSHLLNHTSGELGAIIPALVQEGYAVGRAGCEHGGGGAGSTDDPCFCRVTSIELMCPICTSCHESRLSLKDHVEEVHVWSGGDVVAFRREILALVGMEASRMLGEEAWSDVAPRFWVKNG